MFHIWNYLKTREIDYVSSDVAAISRPNTDPSASSSVPCSSGLATQQKVRPSCSDLVDNTEIRAEYKKNTTNQLDIVLYLNLNTQVSDEVRLKLLSLGPPSNLCFKKICYFWFLSGKSL